MRSEMRTKTEPSQIDVATPRSAARWTSRAELHEHHGDRLLTARWVDPDFDPDQRAFYYVRVLEIPNPSWQAYDAKYFGLEMSDEVPMTLQDRDYTSPIWYTP